ncbi:hypothetical protein Btru_057921 [Bulinus truncatus]|nr:hypothetical protein Btru_057921 [Bulinus truncatus]
MLQSHYSYPHLTNPHFGGSNHTTLTLILPTPHSPEAPITLLLPPSYQLLIPRRLQSHYSTSSYQLLIPRTQSLVSGPPPRFREIPALIPIHKIRLHVCLDEEYEEFGILKEHTRETCVQYSAMLILGTKGKKQCQMSR